jgi:hypothetical protein
MVIIVSDRENAVWVMDAPQFWESGGSIYKYLFIAS